MKKIIILVVILLIGIAGFFVYKSQVKPTQIVEEPTKLTIISTKPDPLDEATITPTGDFEITFNKPISEVKVKTSPENLEFEMESVKMTDSEHTFKFKLKKPLELGSGVTFFILTNTKSKDGEQLDKEYIYHLKTVSYKGV